MRGFVTQRVGYVLCWNKDTDVSTMFSWNHSNFDD